MKTTILKLFIFLMMCSNILSAQWETVYFPVPATSLPFLNTVEFRDFNNGFAAGNLNDMKGCILKTINNGTNWDTVYTTASTMPFYDITFTSPTTVFAVGAKNSGNGMIAKSTDFGATWATTTKPLGLYAESFPTPTIGYIAGDFGTVLKTTDSGSTWNNFSTGVSASINSIYFVNSTIGFATCWPDIILKTTNGGLSWTTQTITSSSNIDKLFFPTDSIGYCQTMGCTADMNIFKTTDQGNTWNLLYTIPNSTCIYSIFFTDANTGYIAGQFAVLKTTDGGITWNTQTANFPGFSDFFDDVTDIYFVTPDTGFVVGNSQFYRTNSGGILSVNDQNNSADRATISIYPNPNNGNMTLEYTLNPTDKAIFKLADITGKEVAAYSMNTSTEKLQITNEKLNNGIYFYQIIVNNKMVEHDKLIIIK